MRAAAADVVRATMARHVLGRSQGDSALGDVTLHSHQLHGLERVRQLLTAHRGAVLADDVGLGKTFVALAIARETGRALVLAPAALRETWHAAALRARVAISFHSLEALSRGRLPHCSAGLVVIDEAHHVRSATTRRFSAAAALCREAKVLLMTATPIQNAIRDLRVLLSLFLGERSAALPDEQLTQFVVRRLATEVGDTCSLTLPSVRATRWLDDIRDLDCLDHLLSLPPPLPPAGGESGGVLLTYTLARQWASSRAAFRSALHRRLAGARAMEDALLVGRHPTKAELAAWCFAEGVQQLVFPELAIGLATDVEELLAQVREHVAGVRRLLDWLSGAPDPDVERAATLRRVLADHPGERVVAFSEYADTVAMLYRLASPHERVAMLTHTGGRVAGGPLTRREVLARFSPGAASHTPKSERIDLLITTDVLSEGVNLQDASVAVHLDLPWNPARLEQRVGRLRRIGGRAQVSVYAFAPPAPAERLLALDRRLRVKLSAATRLLGMAGAILPGVALPDEAAFTSREERIASTLRGWAGPNASDAPVVGAARANRRCAVACIRRASHAWLVASDGTRITDDRDAVERVLGIAGGADVALAPDVASAVEAEVRAWLERRGTSAIVDLTALRVARSRRALLHRVEGIARRAPPHVRPRLAPLLQAARTAAAATLSAGAERVLDELATAAMRDDAWLQAIGEFASLHAREDAHGPPELIALLILIPE